MVSRVSKLVLAFALAGLIVPIAILVGGRASNGLWAPNWIMYVWPTSYMFGATSGIVNGFWYEVAAISIIINVVIYSVIGGLIARLCLRSLI